MDVQRNIKKIKMKYIFISAIIILGVIVASFYTFVLDFGGYQVNASSLLISSVKKGDIHVEVRGNGILAPRNIRWITANVDGIVESVNVKAGTLVNDGDLIAEMINPELVNMTEELRWELAALNAENNALISKQENDLLIAQIKIVDTEQKYQHAKLEYDASNVLYKNNTGSVSTLEYNRSKLATEQNKQTLQYTQQQLDKLRILQKEELEANLARINKVKNRLARFETQISSLTVKATESGVIQVMNLEAGQRISIGHNISRIARKDQLIAELKVPERQIRDVVLNQPVTINTHINILLGKVSRIDPSVINGTVQVDVELQTSLPEEARPDLSIEGSIQVANLQDVLYVARPIHAQNTMPGIIYKLSLDGKTAQKVPVIFGKGSANEITIENGLSASDRIIVSSHQAWEHLDKIRIIY